MKTVEEKPDGIVIRVRVQPKASRNCVIIEPDGRIRVALTAPPVEGAANCALIEYMAKLMGVSKRTVAIVGGEKSREKTVRLTGIEQKTVRTRLGLDTE